MEFGTECLPQFMSTFLTSFEALLGKFLLVAPREELVMQVLAKYHKLFLVPYRVTAGVTTGELLR